MAKRSGVGKQVVDGDGEGISGKRTEKKIWRLAFDVKLFLHGFSAWMCNTLCDKCPRNCYWPGV
ncbi:hypothetical protein K0M31_012906 [Melipona bicolor]|uniref:Uncharacterized protein n=1 Tax=Melipona bicolor TaxID=60889 RepID=A0AA40FIR3_9HYME|nr:hypothetical protein K0M31_012906 [Melipona bicolor]